MGDSTERSEMIQVPYIVYEGEQARMERHTKRLVIALIITILLLFSSNALWLNCWMSYDYIGEEEIQHVKVDAKDGIANYIGNHGDIVNGEHYGQKNSETASTQKEVGE